VESKLRCVSFRKVSDRWRAFQSAFGVTGISDDWYRSSMGEIVISMRTPPSAGENFGFTWEHLGTPATSLGAPTTSRGVPTTSLAAPTTSLGAPTTSLGAPTTNLGALMTSLGSLTSSLGLPGSASDKPGSTSNHCTAVWEKRHLWKRCRCAWKS